MDEIDKQMAFELAEIICVMLEHTNAVAASELMRSQQPQDFSAEQARNARMASARRWARVEELSGFAAERLAQLILRNWAPPPAHQIFPSAIAECIQYGFTESARETLGLRDRPEGSDDPRD